MWRVVLGCLLRSRLEAGYREVWSPDLPQASVDDASDRGKAGPMSRQAWGPMTDSYVSRSSWANSGEPGACADDGPRSAEWVMCTDPRSRDAGSAGGLRSSSDGSVTRDAGADRGARIMAKQGPVPEAPAGLRLNKSDERLLS